MLYVLRVAGFVMSAVLILGLFAWGEWSIYLKMARNSETQAALLDPDRTARIDVKRIDSRAYKSAGLYTVTYSFTVPGDGTAYTYPGLSGEPSSKRVSKETYDSLEKLNPNIVVRKQNPTIEVVYLRSDPRFHEFAGDLDNPQYHANVNFGLHLLFLLVVAVELCFLPLAWWVCLGTLHGEDTVRGSLGCKVGEKWSSGDAIEKTYWLTPLSIQVPKKGTADREATCGTCGATVPLRASTWAAARGVYLVMVVGVLWSWFVLYGLGSGVALIFGWWAPFPWNLVLFTAVAVVATAVCSWWTIYLGFADVVTTTADGYHDKHRTFDKVPTDDRP